MPISRAHNNWSKMTALVIDDQFTIRKAICRILATRGFGKILDANNGATALKLLGTCPIDLVITDLFMPEIDGFMTLKNIRNQNFGADIPVIVVTGEGGRDEIIKAIDLGADDYIVKPFQVEDLEKKIANVLTLYQSPPPLLKLLREGDHLSLSKNFVDALKCFEAAERLAPDSIRAKFCKALTLKNLGQSDEALNLLRSVTDKNPTFYKAFRAIGDISLELERSPEAIDAIQSELSLNPKQPERQIQFARLLRDHGDIDGALVHYRTALSESPKNREALLETGLTLGSLGEIKQALTLFRRARRYYPDWVKPLELAVQVLTEKADDKVALTFLNDELSRNPDRADLRILLAKFFLRDDDLSGALKVLDDGLKRWGQNIPLLKAKATLLKRSHQLTNACDIYQEIFRLEPSHRNQLQLANTLMLDKQFQAVCDLLTNPSEPAADQTTSRLMIIKALQSLARPIQALHLLESTSISIEAATELKDQYEQLKSELMATKDELLKLRNHGTAGTIKKIAG